MKKTLSIFALVTLFSSGAAYAVITQATAIQKAHGTAAWDDVERVAFTFTHAPSGSSRSHDWDRKKGVVKVTMGDKVVTVPAAGGKLDGDELKAHQAFINDSYWLLFEHFMFRDDVEREFMSDVDVPGLEKKADAVKVSYPAKGGYTPGDAYFVYMENFNAFAWAYHPGGSEKPKLVTSRADWKDFGGLRVPTAFDTPDGKRFITLADVVIE